ncbi:hypothetical protein IBTHAUMO2_1110005 [Nitrosopumilaceae archaeon]|nr:hypothetical protein [Nitrosopumilus sp.]CAI9830874.1 hypothetical protein IBTHAUMO2_1110005 [Nitrosopumilaceae archaeon]MDA7945317.1 hypothetical protein [Nitrosopumilus sp.]MDA7955293.1 hypothetical protein [Nitrosopumilus sp.]MDA7974229.1 hypothetical protein [Nitrosopumilus sp.]
MEDRHRDPLLNEDEDIEKYREMDIVVIDGKIVAAFKGDLDPEVMEKIRAKYPGKIPHIRGIPPKGAIFI